MLWLDTILLNNAFQKQFQKILFSSPKWWLCMMWSLQTCPFFLMLVFWEKKKFHLCLRLFTLAVVSLKLPAPQPASTWLASHLEAELLVDFGDMPKDFFSWIIEGRFPQDWNLWCLPCNSDNLWKVPTYYLSHKSRAYGFSTCYTSGFY